MFDTSFTTMITTNATPALTFAAINDVRSWWGHDVEGTTDTLGAEFTFYGKTMHRSHIRIVDLVPRQRVEWHVLDNSLTFVVDQTEWLDTRIVFEISTVADGTQIRFSHVGLVPDHECYDVCENAWTFFIRDSLFGLITSGVGQPLLSERATGSRLS